MGVEKFKEFLKLSNFFFRTLGIEAFEHFGGPDQWSKLWQRLLFCASFLSVKFIVVSDIFFSINVLRVGNLIDGSMTFSYIGFAFMTDSKTLSVFRHKRELNTLIDQLLEIFPQTRAAEKLYGLSERLRRYKWTTSSYALLYIALVCSYVILPIIKYVVLRYWLGVDEYVPELPYPLYLPWRWQGHWSYYPLYVSHMYAGYSVGIGHLANDLLLCSTATQMIMHYDYLANAIRHYQPGESESDDLAFLRSIASYHDRLLRLSELANRIFGVSLLCNFLISSVVICLVGFQMTSNNLPADILIKLILFLLSSLAQAYIICHFGQELLEASESVASAIYSHSWPDAGPRYKRMLLIIALRAQKTASLKGTSVLNISHVTMSVLLQISYKFFTLLRTMEAKKYSQ